jgi:glycolate oxidase FAD binding subunit
LRQPWKAPMSTLEGLATALASVVGSAHLLTNDAVAQYAIDGVLPAMVVLPTDEIQIAAVLRLASEYQATVFPRGGGSHTFMGQTPSRVDLVLSVQHLQRQLAYEPADLTTTVQAGVRFCELQRTLGGHGQFLALDPPVTAATTLGGVVATNVSGPRRFLYGTARDVLLGVAVMTMDGKRTKAGGRVVKNVTGYDLNKLYIGSLGTLAIIVELTCKLHPLPPGELTLGIGCASQADLAPMLQTILQLPLRLNSLELLNATACETLAVHADLPLGETAYTLITRVEGTPAVTQSQAQRLTEALRHLPLTRPASVHTWSAVEQERLWSTLGELTRGASGPDAAPDCIVVKVSLLMSALPAFCQDVQENAAHFDTAWSIVAHAGSGIAYVCIPVPNPEAPDVERLLAYLQALEGCVTRCQGRRVIARAPVAVKQQCQVWGPPGDDFVLMRAIKASFDPQHRLNPGRFLGGL